jgi:hypothetical protein
VWVFSERFFEDADAVRDEELDPIETLADLSFRGFELTTDEIDVFIRTDIRTWVGAASSLAIACTEGPAHIRARPS